MYKSLLSTLKPLVFEGKSGVLHVTHKYNDQARIFLKEGIVDQVETMTLQGKKAADACTHWLSITTEFVEGEQSDYTPDSEVDTNSLLSLLEKVAVTIDAIVKIMPELDVIIGIDMVKLRSNDTLSNSCRRIAKIYDGMSSVEDVLQQSEFSERVILTNTCKLLMAGIAERRTVQSLMSVHEREDFFQMLKDRLVQLIGPVGVLLVDEVLDKISLRGDQLTWKEVPLILDGLAENLEGKQKKEFLTWSSSYRQKSD